MEVGTRGNFHAWKLSTFGDGWGVHAPTKQRKIGYPTEKKKGGKKEEGEETRKKNEERNCWTPRERINFTRCGQRKTSGSLKSYLSPFDRSTRSQSFERIVSPISHPFNLSRLRTNVGRNAFNFIHWKSLLVEEKNTKIALRTWNDFEFESHLDRSRRRERSDILEA